MAENFDSLLGLLRRTTDEFGWLQPLLDQPDSAAVLGGVVTVFARLGPAVDHNGAQATITGASGGQPGTAALTVSRGTSGTTGTIPRGYPFVDQRGARAILQTDVVVGGGVTTLSLPLQTERQTELVNTEDDPGFEIAPDAPAIPASANLLIAPAGTPGLTATAFQTVGPSTPIQGGAADYLSVHGAERGLLRQTGEATEDYRQRIRNIPDVVSPIAVADEVQSTAQKVGLPAFETLEPFRDGATAALKILHGLGSFDPAMTDDGFLDDPGAVEVLVDRRTAIAYLEIQAQDYLRDPAGAVMYLDDGFLDDPILGYPDVATGLSPTVLASLLAVYNSVAAKKAAGVNFDIVLKDGDLVFGIGTRSANTFGDVVDLTPAPGTIWEVVEVVASHQAPDTSVVIEHFVRFDLEGGGTLDAPTWGEDWSQRVRAPGVRVTGIHGFLRSDGVVLANLVVSAKVVIMTL